MSFLLRKRPRSRSTPCGHGHQAAVSTLPNPASTDMVNRLAAAYGATIIRHQRRLHKTSRHLGRSPTAGRRRAVLRTKSLSAIADVAPRRWATYLFLFPLTIPYTEANMTRQELHERLAAKTGDDIETIEKLGFELNVPSFAPDRKELKRQRRLRQWRQERRDRVLGSIAVRLTQS